MDHMAVADSPIGRKLSLSSPSPKRVGSSSKLMDEFLDTVTNLSIALPPLQVAAAITTAPLQVPSFAELADKRRWVSGQPIRNPTRQPLPHSHAAASVKRCHGVCR